MARSQASSAKKEKEKQRLQKRKEKEERKEERKANSASGKSFEAMLAYVDENGNITSTPPDPMRKQVSVNPDDIMLGARKREEDKPDEIHTGRVTFFNTSKGYGFIKDDRTQESVFVHINSISTPISDNDKVSFQTERGHKGLAAINVRKI